MDHDQEPNPNGEQPWILPGTGEPASPQPTSDAGQPDFVMAHQYGVGGEHDTQPLYGAAAVAPSGRTSGRVRVLSAAGVLVVGAAAGTLVGHAVWSDAHSSTSTNALNNSGQSLPSLPQGSGEGGSGSNGFGNGLGGSGQGGSGLGSGGFGEFPGGTIPGLGGLGSGGQGLGGQGLGGSSSGGASDSNTSDGPTDAASIAKDVDPGVVDISTTLADGEAAGTGMVLTSNGEVLTNNHVIDGATSISVRDVGNGKTYKATVVGYDRTQDVAVLQLQDASGLSTITAASSQPANGAAVVAIGNAEGVGGTPSYAGGAITKTSASITASDEYDGTSEKLTGLLATDAGVESGDSGGPLVNSSGQVVGMDTAASAGNSNGFGIDAGGSTDRGFAIPITTAEQISQQIESGQASETVHLGETAELGVYAEAESSGSGVLVEGTTSGGPAASAGLVKGDSITAINGTSLDSLNALTTLMSQLTPGQKIEVDFTTADGSSKSTTVTLTAGPPQ